MSFGNSPSTVRQFRRVSPNANSENTDPLVIPGSPTKASSHSRSQSYPASISAFDHVHGLLDGTSTYPNEYKLLNDLEYESRSNRQRSARLVHQFASEDAVCSLCHQRVSSWFRTLYICHWHDLSRGAQPGLEKTANETRYPSLQKPSPDLELVDPEGLYHTMKGIVEEDESKPRTGSADPHQNEIGKHENESGKYAQRTTSNFAENSYPFEIPQQKSEKKDLRSSHPVLHIAS